MKLNWEIIKRLLEKFEDETISDYLYSVGKLPEYVELENFEKREKLRIEAKNQEKIVFGHLLLCLDGKFIEGIEIKIVGNFEYAYGLFSPRLTLAGYELLEKLRDESVWNRIKSKASLIGVPLTVETISAITTKLISEL